MRLGLDCSQHQMTWNDLVRRVRFAAESRTRVEEFLEVVGPELAD